MKTAIKYDYPSVGCYIDESAGSADACNLRTIAFAERYGFDECYPKASGNASSDDEAQIVSEVADDAVSFLNGLEDRSFMYWGFEDNSLFLMANVDGAREEAGFVSSEDQDYPADGYRGEWLHVSDHGNATLYVRGDDGKDKEIWSVV